MNFSRIICIISIWNIFTLPFRCKLLFDHPVNNESRILADIVTNLLVKYFEDEETYLSIIPLLQDENSHFLDDFIFNLFENVELRDFSHSILDDLDDSLRYKHVFNLIIIDNNSSLM